MSRGVDGRWPARYELLDGLRGLACLGVLLHHLGVTTLGHYAVMIFFVISGYCITASAYSCNRQGVRFSGFMLRRVRRIYPPYLFALVFFVVTRIAKNAVTDAPDWSPSALDWLQNLTLTQWWSIPFHPIAWPADNPKLFVAAFWSLNYEEQFYLVMGLALVLTYRWKIELWRTILALFVVAIAWNVIWSGGWITGFFVEYWAHFSLGASVYLLLCEFPTVWPRRRFFIGIGLLSAYCAARLLGAAEFSEVMQRAYIELPLLGMFAICLLLLRPLSSAITGNIAWKPIAALGTISYSLYLVHQFNLTLIDTVIGWALPSEAGQAIAVVFKVAAHIGIGAAFWYVCERPFVAMRPNLKNDNAPSFQKRLSSELRSSAQ